MEFNRFSQRLTVIVTVVIGLISAVVLGKLAGQERLGPILMVALGGAALATLLILKERVWIFLLFTWPMTGQIRALNIPFGVRDIAVAYVFVGYLALVAFKIIRTRNRMTLTDLFMISVFLMLVIAFIRNPVGVEALGSERVGGRPYFNIVVAALAWWILSRSQLSTVSPTWLFIGLLSGRCADGVLATLLYYFPASEIFFADFYSSPVMTSGMQEDSAAAILSESSERLGFFGFLVSPILIAMLSLGRPLSWLSVYKPWKPLLLVVLTFLLMKSGFRSALVVIGAVALVAGYLRAGRKEVIKMAGIGVVLLLFAATFQNVLFNLPKSVQRTLSFLPGNWDPIAVAEGRESTEWRLFMWRQALFTDRYIENKIIGDGFGIKKTDFAIMSYFAQHGAMEDSRENLMIVGNFHSGPVTTIRYIGYVGLALYMVMISLLAREGWTLCKRFRGSPYEAFCYFLCLPVIVEPLIYVFVFGSFDNAMPQSVLALGTLKLLRSALPEKTPTPDQLKLPEPSEPRYSRPRIPRSPLTLQTK